jgi:hypothetical protein
MASAALLVMLAACSGKGEDSADPGPTTTAHVWSGWNHTWYALSHRISLAGVMMEEDGSFTSQVVGGDWSHDGLDYPTYRVHSNLVSSTGLVVHHGLSEFDIGPEGSATVSVTEDVEGIAATDHQLVVLRGFSLDTSVDQSADYPSNYDSSLGYCSNGFGFSAGTPSLSGDSVSFELSAVVRWGPAGPEDPIDRSDMNNAIPFATTGASIGWTVIGWNGDWTPASGSASAELPHTGSYSEQLPFSEDDLGIALSGGSPGFPVLTAFDLHVQVPGAESQGEYLRSYGVELAAADPVGVTAEVTNSSLVETAPIAVSPTVELGWIGLADSSASVDSITLSGEHDIGTATVTD